MSQIKELFDKVLELKDGEVITLSFINSNDLNSKRTMLVRERKKYEETLGDAKQDVFIHREMDTKKKVFRLHLSSSGSMLDWMAGAVIRSQDGVTKNLKEASDARTDD